MNQVQGVLATGVAPSSAAAEVTTTHKATALVNVFAYNADSVAHTFTVAIVPSGASYGDATNTVLANAVSIAAGGFLAVLDHRDPEIELAAGDAVWVVASAASEVTYYVCGS